MTELCMTYMLLSAREVHDGALTSLADTFAIVVPSGDKIPA